MSDREDAVETALRAAYREQAACYAQALPLAQQLPASLREGAEGNEGLLQVLALFEQVAALETRLAPTKERWRQSGRSAGPALREEMDRAAVLIEQLLVSIRAAEQEAIAQRDRLAPQLDAGIRARRMQRAYRPGP